MHESLNIFSKTFLLFFNIKNVISHLLAIKRLSDTGDTYFSSTIFTETGGAFLWKNSDSKVDDHEQNSLITNRIVYH